MYDPGHMPPPKRGPIETLQATVRVATISNRHMPRPKRGPIETPLRRQVNIRHNLGVTCRAQSAALLKLVRGGPHSLNGRHMPRPKRGPIETAVCDILPVTTTSNVTCRAQSAALLKLCLDALPPTCVYHCHMPRPKRGPIETRTIASATCYLLPRVTCRAQSAALLKLTKTVRVTVI